MTIFFTHILTSRKDYNKYDSLSYDTDMSGHTRGHQNSSYTSCRFIAMQIYCHWSFCELINS